MNANASFGWDRKVPFLVVALLLVTVPPLDAAQRESKPPVVLTPGMEHLLSARDLEPYLAEHPESRDEALWNRVLLLGHRLAKVSDRPDMSFDFRVVVGEELEGNGFIGGAVVVSEGLVRFFDDDELAFILGHEIAHVALRHPVSKIRLEAAAEEAGRAGGRYEVVRNDFVRGSELEADRYGALYAVRAGYRFSAGHEALERVLQLRPELARGDADHPELSRRIEALRGFRRELDLALGEFDRGLANLEAGEVEAAIRSLAIFRSEFPQSIAGNLNLGAAYLARLRETAGTPGRLSESFPLVPDHGIALRGTVARSDLEQARASFERALARAGPVEADRGQALALAGLALVFLRLEEIERARGYLEQAQAADPESLEILLARGNTEYLAGNVDAAGKLYAEAIARRPDWPPARSNLARVLGEQGRGCAARAIWEDLRGEPLYRQEAAARLADLPTAEVCAATSP